jgi:hypothetical protein
MTMTLALALTLTLAIEELAPSWRTPGNLRRCA